MATRCRICAQLFIGITHAASFTVWLAHGSDRGVSCQREASLSLFAHYAHSQVADVGDEHSVVLQVQQATASAAPGANPSR